MKLLITNVAYGEEYCDLFLNYHLKSLLDDSNIPAFKDRVEYAVFTDQSSLELIRSNQYWIKLVELLGPKFTKMISADHDKTFDGRYDCLRVQLNNTLLHGSDNDCYVSPMVADHIVAQEYLKRVFYRIDQGHDAVFVLPPRSAAEPMKPLLDAQPGALRDLHLMGLVYNCLHPLWVHCHVNTPQFTKLPFTLIWNNANGLMARSFSITPIAFKPTREMFGVGMIDKDLPHHFKNPYWATDWIDCPVVGVEPLHCYYPMFDQKGADVETIAKFARDNLHPSQVDFLFKTLYFPGKQYVGNMDEFGLNEANQIKDGQKLSMSFS